MNILSLITYPNVVPNHKTFVRLPNTKISKPESFLSLHWKLPLWLFKK